MEKGFILLLNLREQPVNNNNGSGKTLPTIVLNNYFNDWDDYLSALRSTYRRRLKQIHLADPELVFEKKPCSAFTEKMHHLYLEVWKRSDGKLEKLTFDFFRNLPSCFILTICLKANQLIGWNIAVNCKEGYYFFLGGIDYMINKTSQTYFRLLTELIRDGIERKSTIIELGQTAEIPKMRFGGRPIPLYMEAHHGNYLINKILQKSSQLLEYKRKLENGHPMKE